VSNTGGAAPALYDLATSTALITGAAGDIGRAVAVRLASSGARLALTDLASAGERLEATSRQCAELVGTEAVTTIAADVTDRSSVVSCVAAASERLGPPDLVFNNAGYQGAFVAAPDYPADDFSRVMRVNVEGIFNVLQACAAVLRKAGRAGAIVNSASMAADGAPNMMAYSASKGAVVSLTRSAAKDLAPLGIRVNAISPAFIGPGEMWHRQVDLQAQAASQYFSDDPAVVAQQMLSQVPLRRYGSVEEVAAAVVWLLSPEASYITGQNIQITGGI
jgi:NAD(P)-dependent dehydrogenase (short-subunit alcohol dehydrogenase family)